MKAMKKAILSVLVLAMVSAGCAQEKKDQVNNKQNVEQKMRVKPKKANISDKQLQSNISEGVKNDFEIKKNKDTDEALKVLSETQNVLRDLEKNKDKKAKDELAKLIGKIEILLTKDPDLALVPVDVGYEVKDVVTDLQTVKGITEAAKKAMDDGYYQQAKNLMDGLTSELVIKTVYLPYATYPDAMRLAATLLDKGKKDEAKQVLIAALNTLTIQEVDLPLPVLRAEEFIKNAALTMADDKKKDKKEIAVLFLENAEYQLDLAEAMGYGKKDKEFTELHTAIKVLKDEINKGNETKTKFDSLKSKIKKFKERLFFHKK